jgi:hypothetical protein
VAESDRHYERLKLAIGRFADDPDCFLDGT